MEWAGRPDIEQVQIGDTVTVPMTFLRAEPKVKAAVVYIDPKKRFFTAEFNGSHIRESYCAHGDLS